MNAKKLRKIEDFIKPILEESERARNDDFYLYSRVIEITNPEARNMSMLSCLLRHEELCLPSYESITRARRKLQEKYPELESERTRKRRLKEQEEYRKYAKIS